MLHGSAVKAKLELSVNLFEMCYE